MVKSPFGPASIRTITQSQLADPVLIENFQTVLLLTLNVNSAPTLNLTIDPGVQDGATLVLKLNETYGSLNLTYGTGFYTDNATKALTANREESAVFVLSGGKFTEQTNYVTI